MKTIQDINFEGKKAVGVNYYSKDKLVSYLTMNSNTLCLYNFTECLNKMI